MKGRILVTGATGFVGQAIIARLLRDDKAKGLIVGACHRTPAPIDLSGVEWVHPGPVGPDMDWTELLSRTDVVVHVAARVHVKEGDVDSRMNFHRTNAVGTKLLAQQAISCGVRRFIFLSTVAVYGVDSTSEVLDEDSVCLPQSAYALSKYRAESELMELSDKVEVVIVRPPMIYGPAAPGNFNRLVKLVRSGIPLPFTGVSNRRSIIGVQNLADFIVKCTASRRAAGECFVVADDDDVSIEQLVIFIANGLQRNPRIFRVPQGLLQSVLTALGAQGTYEKLFGSFRLNCRKARDLLGWNPLLTTASGVTSAVQDDT